MGIGKNFTFYAWKDMRQENILGEHLGSEASLVLHP